MGDCKFFKVSLLLFVAVILISSLPLPLLGGNSYQKFPLRIELKNRAEIGDLVKLGIGISNMKGNWVEAYVTQDEFKLVKDKGFDIPWIPDYARLMADNLWEATKGRKNPMDAYHTYEELTAELDSIAAEHPDICHLQSIGKSVQGRDL